MEIHNKTILFRIVLGVSLLLASNSTPLLSAYQPIYDIEVVVFMNNSATDDGEHWAQPLLDDGHTGFFPDGEFTELSNDHFSLKGVSQNLERSDSYSILFHRAWRQLAYDKNKAVAYPVHSTVQEGGKSVEGSVKLMLERFLHLDVNLFLMSSNGNEEVIYSDAPGNIPLFELREKRRIKSTELHYFDHPRFGAIAKVTPYIPYNGSKPIEINNGQAMEEETLSNPRANDDQLRR